MTFKDMDKYVEQCQRNHNQVYYCCDAFEKADDTILKYLKIGDRSCYYLDDGLTVNKTGWYFYSDEYGIEYDDPIQYCPWCSKKL